MSTRNKEIRLLGPESSFNLPNLLPKKYCRCNHDGTDIRQNHIKCPDCQKEIKQKARV